MAKCSFSDFFLLIFPLIFIVLHLHLPLISSLINQNEFNPYKTLGIRRTASQKDIKQAYKRMAMEWHPDKNKRPEAEERFMEINQAYKILSNAQRRKAYDTFGITDEQFEEMRKEQFHEQRQHFQYVRWPPPPRKKQTDITHFLLPFGSVLGTLFFIFLIGYLLNKMNANDERTKRRRQPNNRAEETSTAGNNRSGSGGQNGGEPQEKEWHPEDPKAPLTEEEKQQRVHARMWRVMGPMMRELRAETQFGLIRLLKPGCRSIIVLVDKDSKQTLLQQFARHVYCLRNNKTFSFGFLMVPKNLSWFRSLLELTLPEDEPEQPKGEADAESVSTATTDTEDQNGEKVRKSSKNNKEEGGAGGGVGMRAKNKLKEINPKHTLGTVLIICGWKLYFSICHPMHRPPSIRSRIALAELGDEENDQQNGEELGQQDEADEGEGKSKMRSGIGRVGSNERHQQQNGASSSIRQSLNVDNVLNGSRCSWTGCWKAPFDAIMCRNGRTICSDPGIITKKTELQ